jgi:hypothetical protein
VEERERASVGNKKREEVQVHLCRKFYLNNITELVAGQQILTKSEHTEPSFSLLFQVLLVEMVEQEGV